MNSEQSVDYESVIADLKAKRAAIDALIESFERTLPFLQSGPLATVKPGVANQSIEKDTFFGLSVIDAARKYLSMVKSPKSTQDIAAALERGGLTHTSQNFANTVVTILRRQERNVGDIIRVKRDWGLAEWYPGLRRGKGGKSKPDNDTTSETEGADSE